MEADHLTGETEVGAGRLSHRHLTLRGALEPDPEGVMIPLLMMMNRRQMTEMGMTIHMMTGTIMDGKRIGKKKNPILTKKWNLKI